jgi:hypothetical protein
MAIEKEQLARLVLGALRSFGGGIGTQAVASRIAGEQILGEAARGHAVLIRRVRLTLRELAAAGLVVPSRLDTSGKVTSWRITPAGRDALAAMTPTAVRISEDRWTVTEAGAKAADAARGKQ